MSTPAKRKREKNDPEAALRKTAGRVKTSKEARLREFEKRKLMRLVKKAAKLEQAIESKRAALKSVGRFEDSILRALERILNSLVESWLKYIEEASNVSIPIDASEDRVNRLVTSVHNCITTHRTNKRKKKTLAKFIQDEWRQNALDAEEAADYALKTFFRRQFREDNLSPKVLSSCQDACMNSQLSCGSIEALRTCEGLKPNGRVYCPHAQAFKSTIIN